jgi:hypothetical protein
MFTGLKVDYWKELSLAFGDNCKVFDGSDNTLKSRSIPEEPILLNNHWKVQC